MDQRQQSGVELLSTFGIALLIIAIAIAVLLIFSGAPAQTLPTSCSIYGTVKCADVAYGTNSLGVTTLVVLASSEVQGIINVSSFNAVVGGVKSISGYCLTNEGSSVIQPGQSIYCVATFPNTAILSQTYTGTFNITGNYCTGTTTCPAAGSPYTFSGSFNAHATAVSITTPIPANVLITTPIPANVFSPIRLTAQPSVPTTINVGDSIPVNALATGGNPPYTYTWISLNCPGAAASGSGRSLSYVPTAPTPNCVFTFTAIDTASNTAIASTAPIIAIALPYAYIFGFAGNDALTTAVYYAPVYSDGSIGPWGAGNALPTAVALHSCSIYYSHAYCVGGNTISGLTDQEEYATATGSGTGTWYSGTFPTQIAGQNCQTYNNYLYCIGGTTTSGASNEVRYTIMSNGGFAAWPTAAPHSYPITISRSSCQIYNNYAYCVGGTQSNGANTTAVYYAPVLPGSTGTGQWQNTNSYPIAVAGNSCTANNGYLYCVGGPGTNSVYYTQISTSGIDAWQPTTPYPTNTINQEACVSTTGNYIYCVGGIIGSSDTNAVYYAPLSSSGVGTWKSAINYPVLIYQTSVAVLPIPSLPSPVQLTAQPSVPTTINVGQQIPVNAIATGGTGSYTYTWVSSSCPGAATSGSGSSNTYIPTATTSNCVFTFTANDIYTSNTASTANIIVTAVTPPTSPPYNVYVLIYPDMSGSTGSISVINSATQTVTGTISLPTGSFGHNIVAQDVISFSPDGKYAYLAVGVGSNVLVINTATSAISNTISVPGLPNQLVMTPDGKQLYVSDGSSRIWAINIATGTISNTISGLSSPTDMAITPNGNYIYVANNGASTISVISTATQSVVNTIASTYTPDPAYLSISPDGKYVYACTVYVFGGGPCEKINTATNLLTSVATGPNMAFTSDGLYYYKYNYTQNYAYYDVQKFSTATDQAINTINIIPYSTSQAITAAILSPNQNQLYAAVGEEPSNGIYVVNTITAQVAAQIPTNGQWFSTGFSSPSLTAAFTPDGRYLYLSYAGYTSNIVVIDTLTNNVIATIPVSLTPWYITVDPVQTS